MYCLFVMVILQKKAVEVVFSTSHRKALFFVFFFNPCPPNRLLNPMSNFTENDLFAALGGMAQWALPFFSYVGGHCRIQSITPCVMQTGPSSTSRNRSVKGEASQHRPFCEENHPGRPRCLPNLRPGSIHYLGEELLPGQMREPGLVLLSGLEHRGFHFLRAQGAGRES